MIFVDCRKCENLGEGECLKYGNDANAAVAACANDGFENYRIRGKKQKVENEREAGRNEQKR